MDDEAFRKEWEVTRQQGFYRFILMRGARWGTGFAAAYVLGKWMKDDTFDPVHAATAFLVFIVAGCVFGPITWWKQEDRYKRALEQRAAKVPE